MTLVVQQGDEVLINCCFEGVNKIIHLMPNLYNVSGIIQGMGLANERRCYIVTASLILRAHTQYDTCVFTRTEAQHWPFLL